MKYDEEQQQNMPDTQEHQELSEYKEGNTEFNEEFIWNFILGRLLFDAKNKFLLTGGTGGETCFQYRCTFITSHHLDTWTWIWRIYGRYLLKDSKDFKSKMKHDN